MFGGESPESKAARKDLLPTSEQKSLLVERDQLTRVMLWMIGDRFPAFIAFVDVIEADGVNCSTKFFILSQYCVFTRLRELSCQWPSPGRVSQHTKH